MTDTRPPAPQPVSADDATIAAMLEDASIPVLMMSMIHMSGDSALLGGDIRPGMAMLGELQGYLNEDQKARVRSQALQVIKQYRDSGCALPPPPDRNTLHQMMAFVVGDEVPAEYIDMMVEDMDLYGQDLRAFRWDQPVTQAAKDNFKVLVIGAGETGILAGIRLQEAGLPHSIVEKNAGVGGTWFENHYPGARVDVGNHFYSYSFESDYQWPEYFSRQPELAKYFDDVANKYRVKDFIRFNTEVVAASYDQPNKTWQVKLRHADGSTSNENYSAIISAVGQLNRPKIPEIAGADSFPGPSFHTARYDHSVDLTGKRVAVIGTGASAFQLVPEIAPQVQQLVVFQRSPNWCFPNERYHAKVEVGKQWCLQHLPYYARWYRFLLFWMMADKALETVWIDPDWPGTNNTVSELNEFTRIMFSEYMEAQCEGYPQLKAKVIPDYPPQGKRTLQDNGSWLNALKRDNVTLVSGSLNRISGNTLYDEHGGEHAVDVIIYATGFHATDFLSPIQITGTNGLNLHQWWGEEPQTNLGITTPHFPNLFCVYGPGNNLAHGGSLIFNSECQIRYILACFKALLEQGKTTLECTVEAASAYTRRYQQEIARTVWAAPHMHNWFKNSQGKVITNAPWRLVDFWAWTKTPNLQEFTIS